MTYTDNSADPLALYCEDCGAETGEPCRPDCIGQAAELDARHEAAHEAGSWTLVPRDDCAECQDVSAAPQ